MAKLKTIAALVFTVGIVSLLPVVFLLLIKQNDRNNEIANKQLAAALELYKQGKYSDTTIALMLVPGIDSDKIEAGLEDVSKGKSQVIKDAINLDRLSFAKLYKERGWYYEEENQLNKSYPMDGIVTRNEIDKRINEIRDFIYKCEKGVRDSGLPVAEWNRCGGM